MRARESEVSSVAWSLDRRERPHLVSEATPAPREADAERTHLAERYFAPRESGSRTRSRITSS
jgi:hypothetical protein